MNVGKRHKLKSRYEIPVTQFFRYFQLHSYAASTLKLSQYGYTSSPLEDILLDNTDPTKLVTQIYAAFRKIMKENTTKIKSEWEKDLGAKIKNKECGLICLGVYY